MNLLILGGNSDIGFAVASEFAQKGRANIILASRDMKALEKKARDIEIRYQIRAWATYFDATDYGSHTGFYKNLEPKPNGVIVAFGYGGEQKKAEHSFQEARKIIETNYMGAVSILEIIADDFSRRKSGFIIVISSVAGERGRQSNYIYGSAKGALTVYLSGLRNRLYRRNVHVMTVVPGFVRTKMTQHLDLPERLVSRADVVAHDIYKAHLKGKDIVYTRYLWMLIMLLVKVIPEKVFKRLRL